MIYIRTAQEVPEGYTGIAWFSGPRRQPYAVWVHGTLCSYWATDLDAQSALRKQLKALKKWAMPPEEYDGFEHVAEKHRTWG